MMQMVGAFTDFDEEIERELEKLEKREAALCKILARPSNLTWQHDK